MQLLTPEEHEEWDRFLPSARNGTLFQATWWYRAWGMDPHVRVRRCGQGKIDAGICYALGRRWGARALVRPPLTPRNGPAYEATRKEGRYAEITHGKEVMREALRSLPAAAVYDLILDVRDRDIQPFLWAGFDAVVAYTYLLSARSPTWAEGLSPMQRRNLRKAERVASQAGCRLDPEAPFAEVLPLLLETARVKGYSMRAVGRMPAWWESVRGRSQGRTYLLRDRDGEPVCATLMVWDHRSAYYLAGGIHREARAGSSLNLLLFRRMLEDATSMGLDFDFEGSTVPGVERFFRAFGGELRPLYRVLKIRALVPYLIWSAHRFLTGHRRRPRDA